MFTGIIQAVGQVQSRRDGGADSRFSFATGKLPMDAVRTGESICVNGVCLSVVEFDDRSFAADLSAETLARSTLGGLDAGAPVNLERALRASDRLGGHLVSGHVDAVGQVAALEPDGRSVRCAIAFPDPLARFICEKGSICVDGVSLTVNAVHAGRFEVNIIPQTMQETIFPRYEAGTAVNLEVDMLARYLERLLEQRG